MRKEEKLAEGYIWPVCMLPASADPAVLQFFESFVKEKGELHEKLLNLGQEYDQCLERIDRQKRYIAELEKHVELLQKTLDLLDKNMKHISPGSANNYLGGKTMENNVGNVYGGYLPCKKEDVQEVKEALLEQMIHTIRDLAKDDRFWIVKSIPGMTKDIPECIIPEAWIGCDVTVGWKIAIPQMKPPHREIKIKIGDREYTKEELNALPKAEYAAIIEQAKHM